MGLTLRLNIKNNNNGINDIVNVTIIDFKDNGPVINFLLQKKKFKPP